jgi:hypothetical protein
MSKIFALLALLLILTGAVLLAVPRAAAPGASDRSLGPEALAVPAIVTQARDIAEKVNAPLSIVFGLVSLFYSRRSYQVNKERAETVRKAR